MSRSLSKKAIFSLIALNLFAKTLSAQKEVFKCSPQTLDALCSVEKPLAVCALDDDNQYLTLASACEACGYQDTVSYTQGPCQCPQIPCNQGQTCIASTCVNIDKLPLEEVVQNARKLLSQQKHTDALVYIKKIIQQRPNDAYPLYLGALATFGADQFEESLKYVKKAISIDSEVPDFYIIRGRAFHSLKQHDEAEKQFQKALTLGFKDIGLVSFYQAQNLLSGKKNEEAIQKFQQALEYHPQKTSWYVRKALAHVINKEERMAIITCKQGLKIDPKNKQILEFMEQFEIMHSDKQKDLEQIQERNLEADNNTNSPDPQYLNKFLAEREQEQRLEFDRKRLEEKKKKLEKEQKKNATSSEL